MIAYVEMTLTTDDGVVLLSSQVRDFVPTTRDAHENMARGMAALERQGGEAEEKVRAQMAQVSSDADK